MNLYLLNYGIWLLIICLFAVYACDRGPHELKLGSFEIPMLVPEEVIPDRPRVNSRDGIRKRLSAKISAGEPLFVRVFVPLCDNLYQGILPVPKAIGNGQDPNSNLYWGAMYGVRTVFDRADDWTSEKLDIYTNDSILLDRMLFRKRFTNGSDVIVLAEAYDGRQMKKCLTDFFDAARGFGTVSGKLKIPGCDLANPDLVVFNGHNDIIKSDVMPNRKSANRPRDVAAIACLTDESFTVQLEQMNAYPILMTLSLMAPEGYVLKALIEEWVTEATGDEIHTAVAKAYDKYQKCGERGAKGVFTTGWTLHNERDYYWW